MGLDSSPEEFVASLPVPVQRRVEALQELQKAKDEQEAAFRKERAELEAKYEKLYGGCCNCMVGVALGVDPTQEWGWGTGEGSRYGFRLRGGGGDP